MKTNIFLIAVIMLFSITGIKAQVVIGEEVAPQPFSILELSTANQDGGLRLPSLSTTDRDQLFNGLTPTQMAEANGLTIYNTTTNCVNYWNGSSWRSLCDGAVGGWFYMPSIVLDVTQSLTFERDLYLEYLKQFRDTEDALTPPNSPTPGTPLFGSTGAPALFPQIIYNADELYYYVIGYDADVFTLNSLSETGILNYSVNADNVSGSTFMNIIFVVK